MTRHERVAVAPAFGCRIQGTADGVGNQRRGPDAVNVGQAVHGGSLCQTRGTATPVRIRRGRTVYTETLALVAAACPARAVRGRCESKGLP